jgi:hypothetical protein
MWRAPNGARLRFAYLERDADAEAYQGHSYTRVYVEEIGNFPSERPILKLMATLRSGAGVPVGFRATGNPGGPGHQWVKARYIDPAPGGWRGHTRPLTGRERVSFPSRVQDNRSWERTTLRAAGFRLEGTWSRRGLMATGRSLRAHSSIAGKHRGTSCGRLTIPPDWTRFRSGDWGSAKPFSFGWWAVVGDKFKTPDGIWLPRGCLVRYREWYGMQPGKPNTGLKMHAEKVGEHLALLEASDAKLVGGVLDPAAFSEDGGPSIAERINVELIKKKLVPFRPADNKRVPGRGAMGGWDQMRGRLIGDDDGLPMLVMFSTCLDSIRTIPALQHDALKPEDLDSDMEDHAADDTGGTPACRARGSGSRPSLRSPRTSQATSARTTRRQRISRLTEARSR